MARQKNALRGHFIAPFDPLKPTTAPEDVDYDELAKYISSIGDDTDEETDDTPMYDGDGSKNMEVTSVSGAYSPEGFFDPEDPAQALIASMKYKIGDDRKIWHKVVSADGAKQWVGPATVTDIIAGAGDAGEYEDFSCTITYNKIPEETAVTP